MATSSFSHLLPSAEIPEPERDSPRPGPDDDSGKGKKSRKKAASEPEDERDDNDEGKGEDRPDSRKGKKAQNVTMNFYAVADDDDDRDDSRGNQGKKGRKALGPRAEDDDDDDDKKEARARATKRSQSNDVDDDDEDDDDEKEAKARASESRHWQKIMSHPAAQRNVAFAAKLAAMPNLTSKQAIEILEEGVPTATRAERSARNPTIGGATGYQAHELAPGGLGTMMIQSSWDRAFKLARVKHRPIRES
jgi:hypothetical protein